jgi:hypothetical protein
MRSVIERMVSVRVRNERSAMIKNWPHDTATKLYEVTMKRLHGPRRLMTTAVFMAASILSLISGAALVAPACAQVEIVKDFVQYGTNPQASLMQASDGFLYGTTLNGGAFGGGTLFHHDFAPFSMQRREQWV